MIAPRRRRSEFLPRGRPRIAERAGRLGLACGSVALCTNVHGCTHYTTYGVLHIKSRIDSTQYGRYYGRYVRTSKPIRDSGRGSVPRYASRYISVRYVAYRAQCSRSLLYRKTVPTAPVVGTGYGPFCAVSACTGCTVYVYDAVSRLRAFY